MTPTVLIVALRTTETRSREPGEDPAQRTKGPAGVFRPGPWFIVQG
ncbi:MAG TPA: hypothetical protein VI074_01975 [Propionibacteriaceae bacterium]